MTRAPATAPPHHSALLRFLGEQGWLGATGPADELGQRLAQWLDFRHAIALQAVIGAVDNPTASPAPASARVDAAVLRQRFEQVRSTLEQAIVHGSVPASGLPRIEPLEPALAQPIDVKTAFDPLRRFYLGHQRQMDSIVRAWRIQLRGMLGKSHAAHQLLATLDGIFETMLADRQTRLLGLTPSLFEKRFTQHLKQHMKQGVQADQAAPDKPEWLVALCQDMRTALLAELDLRLQPVLGLIEALSTQTTTPS